MTSRQERDRRFRRILLGGILASAAAHAAVLAVGRLSVAGTDLAERGADVRLVALLEPEPEQVREPLEVIELRPVDTNRSSAPGSGSTGSPAARGGALPAVAHVPASLSGTIPDPIRMLEKIEQIETDEPAVTSYASVNDHLIQPGATARPLRPIDDRPVEELAAIAARSPRGGVSVGIDPDCPPGHGGLRR